MSLESWKKEFYPIPADEVSKAGALDHSIRKWEGLQEKNLKKHEVFSVCSHVCESCATPKDGLLIAGSSCALCCYYYCEFGFCPNCPINIYTGMTCEGGNSPWVRYRLENNPSPMLALLKRVKELVEKDKNTEKE